MHFRRDVDRLRKKLLSLGGLVEEQVCRAVGALVEADAIRAREVVEGDAAIDRAEVEVEEDCLKILALHRPVTVDLRFIVAVLKINNDLERIGDLAVNIARKTGPAVARWLREVSLDLVGMSREVQRMLHDSLDSLVNLDTALAADVCGRDDRVDEMKREMRALTEEMIRMQPDRTAPLLNLLAVSRNLERIADLATNIAEDVIYMVDGKIVRHRTGDEADRILGRRGFG